MDTIKILEIAAEAGLSNSELLEKAKELGFDVKAANSAISIDEAGILVDYAISDKLPSGFNSPKKSSKKVKKEARNKTIRDIATISNKSVKTVLEEAKKLNFNVKRANSQLNPRDSEKLLDSLIQNDISQFKIKYPYFSTITQNRITISSISDYLNKSISFILKESKKFNIDIQNENNELTVAEAKKLIETIEREEVINIFKNKYPTIDITSKDKVKISSISDYLNKSINYILKETKKLNLDVQANDEVSLYIAKEILKNLDNHNINLKKYLFSNKSIEYNFPYKNILFKGVPGTGKSLTINNIIKNHLNLKEYYDTNVLRINIHSASSNADLMQGIAINSNSNGNIEYKEKQGLILEFIEKATFNPNQPFVLILEEIQENSLNELIGDLIYLIEDSKRAKGYIANNKQYTYLELIDEIMNQNNNIDFVRLPSLITKQTKIKSMIIPDNLFIFCASNYRDDKKVIEDNLLRRFEVIEIYPKYKEDIGSDFKSDNVSNFLKELNKSIVKICRDNGEIHPDRFMIGHSIWLNVKNKDEFSRAFLKVITEFKDIKDMHFDDFKKITHKLNFPFELEKEYESYEEWIKVLQKECYSFLSDK